MVGHGVRDGKMRFIEAGIENPRVTAMASEGHKNGMIVGYAEKPMGDSQLPRVVVLKPHNGKCKPLLHDHLPKGQSYTISQMFLLPPIVPSTID